MSYEKDQAAWIKQVKLKDGDRVKVIVDPDSVEGHWACGVDLTRVKAGDILIIDAGVYAHDHRGISARRRWESAHSVYGLPFFCLIKL